MKLNTNFNFVLILFIAVTSFTQCQNPNKNALTYKSATISMLRDSGATVVNSVKTLNLVKDTIVTTTSGGNYIVEGFYVNENVPMLIKDMKLMQLNSIIPKDQYLLLSPVSVTKYNLDNGRFYGAYVQLRIHLQFNPNALSKKSGQEFDVILIDTPKILKPKLNEILLPRKNNLAALKAPSINAPGAIGTNKVALLYSGGYNIENAHSRYWNDLKFMYLALKTKCGFTDDNIIVVYKDGSGNDNEMKVDFAANRVGLKSALNVINNKLNNQSLFFFFTTNHGGGYDSVAKVSDGGRLDAPKPEGDEIDPFKYDETIYYYNDDPAELWDDTLRMLFKNVNYKTMVSVHEPCFGGGLLFDLLGSNRVNISASNEYQSSYGAGPGDDYAYSGDYDVFCYYFVAALNGANYDGSAISGVDANGDGKISILEAFNYAKNKDKENEKPQLDDNGDGIPTNTPSSVGADGKLASRIFLGDPY